ncbi:hypothetical protein [Staphylococcus devriesei]|uniref:NERD domain-containing protein n=1 Tax=Staphylococcus devriesei TaxID=586733 RepID=A0A2K4DFC2_9STAP|nr:hypothetical protein [Staphylococcus devriesei]MCE5089592.1 hypothetical protein [Staphylococcus devriesei]MCE5096161.1 hypothetical protein [Staphylococcus devriesei]PNZ85428.1 hypothetical protein CD147_11635 [Staphylococcus devriesei]PTF01637.1 hypothetical protein BUY45_11285 [Staphylococcus devriesei]PTF10337.1 hypothetical protein BUY48_11240 [Staphylococcus devriesei]
MTLTIILLVIIVILILMLIINQRYMQDRVDTEVYARNQMVTKNSILSSENLELKNQMLSSNNDVSSHAKQNAKHVITNILENYKEEGKLKYYDIITTSNLATKHPFFEHARTFDYIVVSDIGLINIDVKNWKQKTFYHFDAPITDEMPIETNDVNQIVGHYISKQYHSQFDSPRSEIYTFIEKIQNNRVVYDFYDHDPYEQAAINSKSLKDGVENHFNHKIQSIGIVYFSDGSVNIIEGAEEREKYVDTVSTKTSLENIIKDAIKLSKHPLSKDQVTKITNSFSN